MIPNDPIMLFSYLNTQLRDNYPSFEELASSLDIDKEEVLSKLEKVGYVYDEDANRFVKK